MIEILNFLILLVSLSFVAMVPFMAWFMLSQKIDAFRGFCFAGWQLWLLVFTSTVSTYGLTALVAIWQGQYREKYFFVVLCSYIVLTIGLPWLIGVIARALGMRETGNPE